MLAKSADKLPLGDYLYEPKWDGFRAIVFRQRNEVYIQSRDARPLDRFFPELHDALLERLSQPCALDGEIVIAGPRGLSFEALQLRLHPAASRVAKLSREIPASFVAFDVLALRSRNLMSTAQSLRREELEKLLKNVAAPVHLTPVTRAVATARAWLARFEGAGLDGVVAKLADATYQPGKRVMIKVKHSRTADCVVAGFRWYRGSHDAVGSLLLGLYDEQGHLQHVGVTSSFTMAMRHELLRELAAMRKDAARKHPWCGLGSDSSETPRGPGAPSRWSGAKDLAWEPLKPRRVCEVRYDHMQGNRFRHAAHFLRWRPDKRPKDCRYDQLEIAKPFDLARII